MPLFVVATPIGNLEDISQRALRILSEADLILAEDTRVSRNLLNHFKINTPLLSYHQHSKLAKIDYILDLLGQGKHLALISDAGTPGISDPGGKLVEAVFKKSGNDIKIEPAPGPSALTAIASVCGFPMDRFLFLGFPPQKKKRKQFFEEVLASKYPVIFYESPYRILKTLTELSVILSGAQHSEESHKVVAGRELTKKFETIYRGNIEEVAKKIESDKVGGSIKGEFAVVFNKK